MDIVKERVFLKCICSKGFSVTRLGDLFDFGQVFKAFDNN